MRHKGHGREWECREAFHASYLVDPSGGTATFDTPPGFENIAIESWTPLLLGGPVLRTLIPASSIVWARCGTSIA